MQNRDRDEKKIPISIFGRDRGGLPDLDLDPTRPDFCRDIIPLGISRPCLPEMHNLNPLNFKIFFEQFSINVIKRRQEDIRRRKRGPNWPINSPL